MGLQLRGGKKGRNELCSCGSYLKFKKCHGDPLKQAVCNRVANEKMVQLIREEQRKQIIRLHQEECETCSGKGVDSEGLKCLACQFLSDDERIAEEYNRRTKSAD